MKVEYKIFLGFSAFVWGAAILYAFWSHSYYGHTEMIGTVALIMSGLLTFMCGTFFWIVARRIDLRPEDREDGEIAEGAGEIGFFSPGSYWPFGIALAVALAGIGLVYLMWWLIALGLVLVIFGASSMLFEYYSGTRHPAEH